MYQPTDLQTMMETRTGPFRIFWRRLVGDEKRTTIARAITLYFTDEITKPLLITHSARSNVNVLRLDRAYSVVCNAEEIIYRDLLRNGPMIRQEVSAPSTFKINVVSYC